MRRREYEILEKEEKLFTEKLNRIIYDKYKK